MRDTIGSDKAEHDVIWSIWAGDHAPYPSWNGKM